MKQTILSIETSCDETSIALIKAYKDDTGVIRIETLSHIVNSQAKLHAEFGGVFPALAKREHAKNLVPILLKIIEEGSRTKDASLFEKHGEVSEVMLSHLKEILSREPELYDNIVRHLLIYQSHGIDAIAVTHGPGLEPALWVGINFARALGTLWNIPVIPINHMEGHLVSALFDHKTHTIKSPAFPLLTLLISGGHTELIFSEDWHIHTIIGKTRDDAVGEAYDKTARLLDLPYPGGPHIATLAENARLNKHLPQNIKIPIVLPRPMIDTPNLDFSFSGLKTAVLYLVKDLGILDDTTKEALAGEFEEAVADILSTKLARSLQNTGARSVAIGGGVIANQYIRTRLIQSVASVDSNITVYIPQKELATDNAYMIALVLAIKLLTTTHRASDLAPHTIEALGNLHIS